ncbi:MAG: Membrane-associated zinc metalloprotease [uncultured Caballeronia sp.]|nr:MAG: Membrane-associated zinc metalloprotease [uncultured Caballeronia sp.]
MNFLTEIVAFVVAIGVLVVVHEFGHYSVARLCGVKVLCFSVGFGKPLRPLSQQANRRRMDDRRAAARRLREDAR